MTSDFLVVTDACVLAPQLLCDLLLRLAETPRLYLPRWSEEILAEVQRTQINKMNFPEQKADSWQEAVRETFPEAMVAGCEKWMSLCHNDEKDRHVLAAALEVGAEVIVTSNLRHFPRAALEPFGVTAVHPADHLLNLYEMNPGVLMAKLGDMASDRGVRPEVLLWRLAKVVPAFSRRIANEVGWELSEN